MSNRDTFRGLGRPARPRWRILWALPGALLRGEMPASAAVDPSLSPDAETPPPSGAQPDGGPPELRPGPAIKVMRPPEGSDGWPRACSVRHRLCVRPAPGTPAGRSAAALVAADRAWETVTGILDAPAPQGGAGQAWNVFLVDSVEGGARAFFEERDPLGAFDRGASFAVVDRALDDGCTLDLALARAVAQGSLWSAAPTTDEGSARAEAETLARLSTPCAAADGPEVREFQGEPDRCVVDPGSASFGRGAFLFFDWIDARFGASPGALVVGLWALAPTKTPNEALARGHWTSRPTGFDVLRRSLADALWRGSTFDDVVASFGVARATMPAPVPRPAVAFSIPWPATARRFASPKAVAPTGASYVLVDRKGAAAGARLRVQAEWEDYARMRWTVLKLNAAGVVLAEIPVRSLDRQTRAYMTVEALDEVDRVLIVGVNVGSTEHPFDPDQAEWEPHGWLLTVAAE